MLSYKEKYLKYKEKYINFKNTGGTLIEVENCMRDDYYIDDIIFTVSKNKINLEENIRKIKLKKSFTFDDFMTIEEVFNNLNNINSFIAYYKKTLLLQVKISPHENSVHNTLYTFQSGVDALPQKNHIDTFFNDKVLNQIKDIKKLLYDEKILDKLRQLKLELERVPVPALEGDIEAKQLQLSQIFYRKQNIAILDRYIDLIEKNLLNKELQKIEDEASKYMNTLWFELKQSSTNMTVKNENYKNILLKLHETATLLKFPNILVYHQQKQKVPLLKFEEIKKLLLDKLIEVNDNHSLLRRKVDPEEKITTIEEFNKEHESFIERKYGATSKLIQDNINVPNLIESLRWIVFKYYNLLMVKSKDCKPYKDSIIVYEFFDLRTKLLVGVVYFDLNYDMEFSRGYIFEFRTRYSYTNTAGKNVVVIPIIHLYIDFKKISLFEMKSRLFHEFGHAIHTILSQNNYQDLSPYNMRAEYAEIMSQFFESYILEKELLSRFLVIEPIQPKDIPNYDDLPKQALYDDFNFEVYFIDFENKFLDNINYFLSCLLEINLKVLPKEELEGLNISEYSATFLQDLKRTYSLPEYVTYKKQIFKDFEQIFKYPIYYVYLFALMITQQIRAAFGETLFDLVKTNLFINDILKIGNIFDISGEIQQFLFKLKQI